MKQMATPSVIFSHVKFNVRLFMTACPVLIASCNLINPAEPVPAYIHLDSASFLSTDTVLQGTSTHRIADAWAFVDGNIVGAFELPSTFPVLAAGTHTITIRPGILMNGIAATRTIYPFYTGYDTVVNLESQKTFTLYPRFTYLASATFSQLEDFDHSGMSFSATSTSDTSIVPEQDAHSLEGKSGKVTLDDSHPFFECASNDSFPLPVASPVYMELDYLADNEFTVGLISYTFSSIYVDDIVTFKAGTQWKKEYINLLPYVRTTANAYGYKIFIKATKSSSLTKATIYFDNIKVIHG